MDDLGMRDWMAREMAAGRTKQDCILAAADAAVAVTVLELFLVVAGIRENDDPQFHFVR